ncbi:MAG: SHOCT domain-containing protein [Clostridium sp.]|uniref:SHOCT domain-containing protein n=1 Tax=Clostridium sp. TaxID=1506 RepID=UPI002906979B|nr:SHOCT domain-containing protein [Clostridium sp.]MDU7339045.1 SHOCT domain-containing protein [Clostridium sp.]
MKIEGGQGKFLFLKENAVKIVKISTFASDKIKVIPFNQITGVDIKKPGGFYKGYIQFQTAGQTSPNNSNSSSGGIRDAVNDENSVLFVGEENYKTALKIQDIIIRYNKSDTVLSSADEIYKFKKLMDDGIITREEFEKKRNKLLDI